MKQRLVAGTPAQDKSDIGDEEGTPHDEEEEEDNSKDLKMEREAHIQKGRSQKLVLTISFLIQ